MAVQVFTIPVPTPFEVGSVNCYLVRGEGLMLVDAGPCDELALTALEAGLSSLGYRIEDIDVLVLTHQHYDHLGLGAEIKRRSNSDIAAHRLLTEFAANFEDSMEQEDAYADAVMELNGVSPETRSALGERSAALRRYGASFQVNRPLEEGDRIDIGGGAFEIAFVPGHSPTDILLVHEETRLAIVGDHLIGHISSNPVMHRTLDGRADPRDRPQMLAQYVKSLRKTAAKNLTSLYPGHGPAIEDHRALIAARFTGYETRKARIAGEIATGPLSGARIIERLWTRLPVSEIYLALSDVLGHTDLLIAEGAVHARESGGIIEFAPAETT
jgi:glyoxylase-like metal-dependent hydrolase (beta-lactamase superfamily II)